MSYDIRGSEGDPKHGLAKGWVFYIYHHSDWRLDPNLIHTACPAAPFQHELARVGKIYKLILFGPIMNAPSLASIPGVECGPRVLAQKPLAYLSTSLQALNEVRLQLIMQCGLLIASVATTGEPTGDVTSATAGFPTSGTANTIAA
eukprot:g29043.t1